MMHTVQRVLRGAAGQRSFGKANRPITSRADIPHTIKYTGIPGAAGHSNMYTAPVYKTFYDKYLSRVASFIDWIWKSRDLI